MPIILSAPVAAPVQAEPAVVIVYGNQVIAPKVIDGYESRRESGNIVHTILGRANPDVTLRPAKLRTGTLRLVFADEAEADAAEAAHAESITTFRLMAESRTTLQMTYVPTGSVSRALDTATRNVWIVSVEFQEVYE